MDERRGHDYSYTQQPDPKKYKEWQLLTPLDKRVFWFIAKSDSPKHENIDPYYISDELNIDVEKIERALDNLIKYGFLESD